MTVAIRKIADTDGEYLAYARTFGGRASYFVYFHDDVWGAMALHHFTEMLRAVFDRATVKLTLVDQELSLKHPAVLAVLRPSSDEHDGSNRSADPCDPLRSDGGNHHRSGIRPRARQSRLTRARDSHLPDRGR